MWRIFEVKTFYSFNFKKLFNKAMKSIDIKKVS